MPLHTSQAIVVKRIKLGARDRIVTLFTQDFGKIQVVAKGGVQTKSKFGASLEPFTLCQVIFFGKENANLYNLNSADILDSFHTNRNDYDKLMRSFFLVETVNSFLKERDSHPKLFTSLIRYLRAIGVFTKPDKIETSINSFLLNLLIETGYGPKLTSCVYCNKMKGGAIGFNPVKGGIVCNDCIHGCPNTYSISKGAYNFLKHISIFSREPHLERVTISLSLNREVRKLLEVYIKTHIGINQKNGFGSYLQG